MKKQEKGITLIALVITIIVLLILAGVTIALLTNGSSAPEKAGEAAVKDAVASTKDDFAMAVNEALTTYYHDKFASNDSSKISGADAGLISNLNTKIKAVKTAHAKNGLTINYTEVAASGSAQTFSITATINGTSKTWSTTVAPDGTVTPWNDPS